MLGFVSTVSYESITQDVREDTARGQQGKREHRDYVSLLVFHSLHPPSTLTIVENGTFLHSPFTPSKRQRAGGTHQVEHVRR